MKYHLFKLAKRLFITIRNIKFQYFKELMAMREEKADLRGKVYIMEKEKKSLELTIGSMNAQEMALKTHIQHLQDELENQELLVIHLDSVEYYSSSRL